MFANVWCKITIIFQAKHWFPVSKYNQTENVTSISEAKAKTSETTGYSWNGSTGRHVVMEAFTAHIYQTEDSHPHEHTWTNPLPNPQTDWRAKIGTGNALDGNKTFGIFFPQSNSKTAPPEDINQPKSRGRQSGRAKAGTCVHCRLPRWTFGSRLLKNTVAAVIPGVKLVDGPLNVAEA